MHAQCEGFIREARQIESPEAFTTHTCWRGCLLVLVLLVVVVRMWCCWRCDASSMLSLPVLGLPRAVMHTTMVWAGFKRLPVHMDMQPA